MTLSYLKAAEVMNQTLKYIFLDDYFMLRQNVHIAI